ncbi:TPA: 1-(5-phosphoribosyl)-5-[(5-phosphoribosylamino)methylideneamino]imidazole-4-carboxamide isomerase [bacterium]|nr:1-(5-phosphoribosyl)-5-[(5-phosphoribosylamino)methylideneamino]imidazole-4-carboxamide isomerase [bacterium]
MIIYPAVDIREGRVVRLTQGKFDEQKIYSEDPIEVALGWKEEGAKALHVVDLDGAFFGKPQNLDIVEKICSTVKIPVQFGGGIRNFEILEKIMDIGISFPVLGTSAILDELFLRKAILRFGERVRVGLDVKGENIAIMGWQRITDYKPVSIIKKMVEFGLSYIILTDIERDGMLSGPNISLAEEILEKVSINVIISGGISSLSDVVFLKRLPIAGIIIGKALYEKKINFSDVMKLEMMDSG